MSQSTDKQRFYAVSLLLLWCIANLGYWLVLAADKLAFGLIWNLLLAAIPLFMSAAFQTANDKKLPVLAGACFGMWLLFLPNAPYLLTDLVHLRERPPIPMWYVLAMLLSCAGTGTLLGYLSLINIQDSIERHYSKTAGWLVAGGSLMLCAFGIYMGRFLRWNSWDLLTTPMHVIQSTLAQFVDPGPHPHPVGVTLIFGLGLIIGYLALRAIASPTRVT